MKQCTSKIAMIRPRNFGYNTETALTNSFQNSPAEEMTTAAINQQAVREFDEVADLLSAYEIDIHIINDASEEPLPDAVFPNNWFSTFENTLITYPMFAPIRRKERNEDYIQSLKLYGNYTEHKHFEAYEEALEPKFLEGTGSLVLDRVNKLAYAAISPRTDAALVKEWCEQVGYTPVIFNAYGPSNELIYHTNVMMCVGDEFAVVCVDCIDKKDRARVIDELNDSNKTVVEITQEQTFKHFAGNMIQLASRTNDLYLVMSQNAYDHLTPMQIMLLKYYNKDIISCPIPTIENIGGGSIRCMIAELF